MKNISAAILFFLMLLFAQAGIAQPAPPASAPPAAAAPPASAAAPGTTNIDAIKAALKPEAMSNYSKPQYAAIFGCPGGFFKGTEECTDTVFGYVVGQFNTIALIMGVTVLLYILFGGAINSAASGEVLGRSWSSAWLPIRVAAAFGLIIPTANIAPYSPSQMAPMYAIVIGDNLATAVTKNIAKKVADKDLTTTPKAPKFPNTAAIAMAGSVFCAANEWNALTKDGKSLDEGDTEKLFETVLQGKINNDEEDVETGSMPYNYNGLAGKGFFELIMGPSGKCGTLTIPTVGAYEKTTMSNEDIAKKKEAYDAVAKIVFSDMTAYAEIENTMRINGLDDGIMELMLKTGSDVPAEKVAIANDAKTKFSELASTLPERINAALAAPYAEKKPPEEMINRTIIHYTDINKLLYKLATYNSQENSVAIEAISSLQNNSWDQCFAATKSCREKLSDEEMEEIEEGTQVPSTMLGMQLMKQVVKDSPGLNGISIELSDLKEPSSVLNKLAKSIKIGILEAFSDYRDPGTGNPADAMNFTLNPMVLFHNLATTFASIASSLTVLTALAAVAGSPGIINGSIFSAFSGLVMPIIYMAFTACLGMVWITVVPIVIGFWGYLSIIIMGIQGVAAAPFAVVLLATPEGHGMMTSTFQRFLLHWTHLILAPMIFVLGAVASLTLIIVGANIAIWTFVVDMSFFGSDSIFVTLGSIGIFFYVLYQLVIKLSMFQLSLQSEIMEILGGNFHKPLGQDLSREAMAGLQQATGAAKQTGEGLKATGGEVGKGIRKANQFIRDRIRK